MDSTPGFGDSLSYTLLMARSEDRSVARRYQAQVMCAVKSHASNFTNLFYYGEPQTSQFSSSCLRLVPGLCPFSLSSQDLKKVDSSYLLLISIHRITVLCGQRYVII